jgi:hypothetical protein
MNPERHMVHAFHKTRNLLLALLLLAGGRALAQFEGVVESQNLTTDDEGKAIKFPITMWIKNDRIRVETGAIGSTPPTTMIYRSDRKIVWMLNDEERSYFEILQNAPGVGGGAEVRPPQPNVHVSKTGKKRKILGYPCSQFIIRQGDQVTEIWGTRSLGDLLEVTSRILGVDEEGTESAWNEELRNLGMFTLAATTRVGGKVLEAQETTKIQSRTVDEEKFELPEGYKKQVIGEN